MKIKFIESPLNKYSESFKKQVVREYESGLLNKDQLMRKYSIGGKSMVLEWCRKYGKLGCCNSKIMNGRLYTDPQKNRIKELEKKLKEAESKLKAYEKLIEITNRELNTDVVKKIGARLSGNWQEHNKQASALHADSLALPNKRITNQKSEEGKGNVENKLSKKK
jgi:transposase-like protein